MKQIKLIKTDETDKMSTLYLKTSEGSNGNYTHCWLQSRGQAAHSQEVGQNQERIFLICFKNAFPGIFCPAKGCNMAWQKRMLRWTRR